MAGFCVKLEESASKGGVSPNEVPLSAVEVKHAPAMRLCPRGSGGDIICPAAPWVWKGEPFYPSCTTPRRNTTHRQ